MGSMRYAWRREPVVVGKGSSRRRAIGWIIAAASVLGVIAWADPAFAGQASAPASIIGRVTDESGAVLPGVTVTATGPALQVPQVVSVTDAQGEYRLTPLPIGTYTTTYELTGFTTVRRENIRLTVGFIAKLDQVLAVGSVSETLTVSAASPIVDVTSTVTRTEISHEQIESLPTSRDGLKAFFALVPGMRQNLDVAMSGITENPGRSRINGQTGSMWTLLDGVRIGGTGAFPEYSSVDGARAQTAGSNAEAPMKGVLLDMVVKSGGNKFSGELFQQFSNHYFQSNNIDADLMAYGVRTPPKLHYQTDSSANVGGRIIRDKLWFYGAARRQGYKQDSLDAFFPDGTQVALETRMTYHVEKLSYQPATGHKLIFLNHFAREWQFRGANRFVAAESREINEWPYTTRKIEWQAVHSSSLMTSVQYGYFAYPDGGQDGITPDKPSTIDLATQAVTGQALSAGSNANTRRQHGRGIVTWYRGAHEFKGGVDGIYESGGTSYEPRGAAGEYQLRFNNGLPAEIEFRNTPIRPKAVSTYLGSFVSDNWRVGRSLTLSLGLRYERSEAYVPEQCREAAPFAQAGCFPKAAYPAWNSFAPRVHFAYDVLGNGRLAIKGGYGLYNEIRDNANALSANTLARSQYRWRDLNGNRNYDAGEVNLDPNGPDFISTAQGVPQVPNPDQKQPRSDEFLLSLEHELAANFGLSVTGIYARNRNIARLLTIARPYEAYNIPTTRPDPGADNVLGTADDPGTSITFYEYPVALRGAAFDPAMLITDPESNQDYKTLQVAATRRRTNGWQLSASFATTKRHIPAGSGSAYNPNTEIFTANDTWDYTTKISGGYTLPYGINGSAIFEYRNGEPRARQVQFRGQSTITNIVLNVEPVGARHDENTTMLDLRGAKTFNIGRGQTLDLRVELFNVLNINSIRNPNLRSGPDFLAPVAAGGNNNTAIVPPRLLEFIVAYRF